MFKKLFLILFFLCLTVRPAFAANSLPAQRIMDSVVSQGPVQHMSVTAQCEATGTIDNAQCYTGFSLAAIMNAGSEIIDGNLLVENNTGGAIGAVNSFIATLYSNPGASSVDYLQNIANNAGFPTVIKPVYAAAGFGFSSLKPFLKLWEAMRNISYLLFAAIFIIVGLMIVLRVKIDPKTVITIQSALPKIIWTLVIITFSYPIAGFMIDIMYVTIGLVFSIVDLSGLYTAAGGVAAFAKSLETTNFIEIMKNLGGTTSTGVNVGSAGAAINNNEISKFTSYVIQGLLGTAGISKQTLLGKNVATDLLGPILGLFISLSIFIAMLKTFFNLLTSYGTILFNIILSPIILLGEAIPGRSAFTGWIKSLAGNLLVFPLTILMLLFGRIILQYFIVNPVGTSDVFIPPLVGVPVSAVGALLGYIIIMTIPHAQDLLNDWLSIKASKSTEYWKESVPFRGTAQKGFGNVTGALTRLIPI